MAFTDMVPWSRNRSMAVPQFGEGSDPFLALSRNVNRLLDDFTRGFGMPLAGGFGSAGTWPHVEVRETDKEMAVVAELPGMEQNDVEVSLHDGVLTLKGEKKSETKSAVYSERWHGEFQRSLQVGPDIDPDRVNASFKNGVLTVTLGKRPEAQRDAKRIPISNG
jgi:HSP20 family protein